MIVERIDGQVALLLRFSPTCLAWDFVVVVLDSQLLVMDVGEASQTAVRRKFKVVFSCYVSERQASFHRALVASLTSKGCLIWLSLAHKSPVGRKKDQRWKE